MVPNHVIVPAQTSTPKRYFATVDISSICACGTDESAPIEPSSTSTNVTQNDKLDHSIQQQNIAYRKPKLKMIDECSALQQHEKEKTIHDEIVNDLTMNSIASAMDMSSIAEWNESVVNEKKSTTESSDSFEISKSKLVINSTIDSFLLTENKTEENIDKNESQPNRLKTILTNNSLIVIDHSMAEQPISENNQTHQNNVSMEPISLSSTSISTTLSTNSTTISTVNIPKLSVVPKVGWSNSVHELSAMSQQNESSQKLVMKGGKWRRTIFEARRNKITQCKLDLNTIRHVV